VAFRCVCLAFVVIGVGVLQVWAAKDSTGGSRWKDDDTGDLVSRSLYRMWVGREVEHATYRKTGGMIERHSKCDDQSNCPNHQPVSVRYLEALAAEAARESCKLDGHTGQR
jgi:hypothetical protein